MEQQNEGRSVPECEAMPADLATKGLEIAVQEVANILAAGGLHPPKRAGCASEFVPLPKGVDYSDLCSLTNLSVANFVLRYPDADQDDLRLLRAIIRGDLANALKQERRRAAGVEIPPGIVCDEPGPVSLDFADLAERGVITLPQAEALMFVVEGYSQEEIARILGITQEGVCQRLAGAKRRLKKYFNSPLCEGHRADIVGREDGNANPGAAH